MIGRKRKASKLRRREADSLTSSILAVLNDRDGGDSVPNGGTVNPGFYTYELILDLDNMNTKLFEVSLLYTGDNEVIIRQNGTTVSGSAFTEYARKLSERFR